MTFRIFINILIIMFTLITDGSHVCCGKYQSCFFTAPKNQSILGVLNFITLKFFNVVPATNSHIGTACLKIASWTLFPGGSFLVIPHPTRQDGNCYPDALQELDNNSEKMLNTTTKNLLAWLEQCDYSRYCIQTVWAHWKSRYSLGRKKTKGKSQTFKNIRIYYS